MPILSLIGDAQMPFPVHAELFTKYHLLDLVSLPVGQ